MDIKPVRRPPTPSLQPPPLSPIYRTAKPAQVNQPPQPNSSGQLGQSPTQPNPVVAGIPALPSPTEGSGLDTNKKPKMGKKKLLFIILAAIIGLAVLLVAAIWVWYQVQLSPVNSDSAEKVKVEIVSASSPPEIATLLQEKGIIKNKTAFLWFTRFDGTQNKLQAGTYRLSPSESVSEIVGHLVNGSVDTFEITFYPGATLVDTVSEPDKRIDVTTVLKKAGYSQEEISAGLNKHYDHALFQDKPASANLEGYVFGETYRFNSGVSVDDILNRTFDEFYKWVVQDDLVAAYKEKGLTLYQGITLASIVQRESGGNDKAQIAQVFYSRLAKKMPLGSDVTYQYIADKTGVVRDPNLDSPYNTRRYAGLPPGPIATPGLSALQAVAEPAAGDYLYFLSGDDHVTYFARTLDEHEANIANHCKVKCQII